MTSAPHSRSGTSAEMAEGLVLFTAVMLLIAGILDICRGIMAIAKDDIFVVTPGYVFKFDLAGWGWIHLILGVVALAAGIGLFKSQTWARVLGIVVATLLIISNFLSLPYTPVWAVVAIAICVFVIWGLCVAGRDAFTGGAQGKL
ncbi:hypothetical protein V1460_19035 [Streptomyces sp. SCSIO 30461]|uniref:DUF7144 family membrane protein n=1 Tax=Streptomyces sp. SCSIO 30461 TaxID=3118085 RepID=UPI0030D10193